MFGRVLKVSIAKDNGRNTEFDTRYDNKHKSDAKPIRDDQVLFMFNISFMFHKAYVSG